jgi:hypothetical protein
MQFTRSTTFLLSFVLLAQAASVTTKPKLAKRGSESDSHICQKQGSGQCTLAVSENLTTNGFEGGTSENSGEQLLDHDCNYITSDNEVNPKSPGFSGTISGNGLSQPVYFAAGFIGTDDIEGISYQYNGQSYNQGNCDCSNETKGVAAITVCRCPFACPV